MKTNLKPQNKDNLLKCFSAFRFSLTAAVCTFPPLKICTQKYFVFIWSVLILSTLEWDIYFILKQKMPPRVRAHQMWPTGKQSGDFLALVFQRHIDLTFNLVPYAWAEALLLLSVKKIKINKTKLQHTKHLKFIQTSKAMIVRK